MNNSVVFIGCGKVATTAAITLHKEGKAVLAVRRNTSQLPNTLPSHAADVTQPNSLAFLSTVKPHTIVYSIAANGFNEQSYTNAYVNGLSNVIEAGLTSYLKRLIFVSSTSVYHQSDGSIVDETSATEPQNFNGQIMLKAEQLALNTGVGACLRFSGIYGPDRLRMINRVRDGQCTPDSSDYYTNRIHSADCSGIIKHLVTQDVSPDIVLGTDSLPALSTEVETFIASELGINKATNNSAVRKPKRIAGSKRCSNKRLLSSGYTLLYPSFREGYRDIISNDPT